MSIDLSKMPKGATHWSPKEIHRLEAFWQPDDDGGFDCWALTESPYWQMNSARLPDYAVEIVFPWTGEGLPPVGIEIEAFMMRNMHDTYEWRRAKVVHGGIPGSEREILVYDLESTAPAWVDEFRPIRTPEQIAAQVRSDAIREMIRVWKVAPTGSEYNFAHDRAAQLYDAGYRKQVEP